MKECSGRATRFLVCCLAAALVCCNLTGCLFAVPLIEGFQDTGVTESGRAAQLKEDLRYFHHAIEDNNKAAALAYASEEFSAAFKKMLRHQSRTEKIVSAKVDFIDLEDDAYSAVVETYVKYFTQTHYIVKERLMEETWKYTHGAGWRLDDYTVIEEDTHNDQG